MERTNQHTQYIYPNWVSKLSIWDQGTRRLEQNRQKPSLADKLAALPPSMGWVLVIITAANFGVRMMWRFSLALLVLAFCLSIVVWLFSQAI